MKQQYGIQMYSVRDVSGTDLHQALKDVAELGYHFIEFAGFFGHSAEEVKGWLDELGLVCSGTHTGLGELTPEKIDATIAYHKTIGCDTLIVPAANWKDQEAMDETIAALNYAQPILAKAGITLCYHNHSDEFVTTPYGKVVEDEIINRTSIGLQIDTFWAFNARLDPIAYLEEHKDRIRLIHLKDGFPNPAETLEFGHSTHGAQGKALGEGKAPVLAVRDWAIKHNMLMVVESEGLDPTGKGEVGRCIAFLKSLEK